MILTNFDDFWSVIFSIETNSCVFQSSNHPREEINYFLYEKSHLKTFTTWQKIPNSFDIEEKLFVHKQNSKFSNYFSHFLSLSPFLWGRQRRKKILFNASALEFYLQQEKTIQLTWENLSGISSSESSLGYLSHIHVWMTHHSIDTLRGRDKSKFMEKQLSSYDDRQSIGWWK